MSKVNSVKEAVNKKRDRLRDDQTYINAKRAQQEAIDTQLIRLNNEKLELERKTINAIAAINEEMTKLIEQSNQLHQEETEIYSKQNKTLLNLRISQKNEDQLVKSIYKTSIKAKDYEEEAKRLNEYTTDLLNFVKAKKEMVHKILENSNAEHLDRIYEKKTKQLIKQSIFRNINPDNKRTNQSTQLNIGFSNTSSTVSSIMPGNNTNTTTLAERIPQFTIQITKPIPIPNIVCTNRDLSNSGNSSSNVPYQQDYYQTQPPPNSPMVYPSYPAPIPSYPGYSPTISVNNYISNSISPSPVSSPITPGSLLGTKSSNSNSLSTSGISNIPTVQIAEPYTQQFFTNVGDSQLLLNSNEFIHHPQIEFQNNVLTNFLSNTVGQLPVAIKGLPGTISPFFNNTSPNNNTQDNILTSHWLTIQQTISGPIIYTWDEYSSLLIPFLVQTNSALSNCAYHTLLKIPRELIIKILQVASPNNIYCSVKYWEYTMHANLLVVIDNCAEELVDIRTISDVASICRNSDAVRLNFVKSTKPRLIGPYIQYDKILEDYAKFMFPQRTTRLCSLMKSLKTLNTQHIPLVPHYLTTSQQPNVFYHLAKMVKEKIVAATEIVLPKKRGRPKKKVQLATINTASKEIQSSLNLPRIDELVEIIMTINEILVKDTSYFINIQSLDRYAPLTLPPYHFLDNGVKIHYKKSARPEVAHYPDDADCFKPTSITIPRSNTCQFCDCLFDLDLHSIINNNGSILPPVPSNSCGYTHCRCFELSTCIPCLILLWITESCSLPLSSSTATAIDPASFMDRTSTPCSRCNYSWSLATVFPVKK